VPREYAHSFAGAEAVLATHRGFDIGRDRQLLAEADNDYGPQPCVADGSQRCAAPATS